MSDLSDASSQHQHRAMLHLLELLMNAPPPGLLLSVLAQRLRIRPAGGAEAAAAIDLAGGLRAFLLRHPALFRLRGEIASAVGSIGASGAGSDYHRQRDESLDCADLGASTPPLSESPSVRRDSLVSSSDGNNGIDKLTMSSSATVMMEVARESEAVRFFQSRLGRRREDRWVPIKSLAGHLSQAPAEVRAVAGPQADFVKFLARHRHVFEIQGELVGLRDTFAATARQQEKQQQQAMSMSSSGSNGQSGLGLLSRSARLRHTHSARTARPRSLLAKVATYYNGSVDDSFDGQFYSRQSLPGTPDIQDDFDCLEAPEEETSNSAGDEYKAIAFLRRVLLERGGGGVTLAQLFSALSRPGDSTEQARDFIGCTQLELEEFLRKRPRVFCLESSGPDAVVSNCPLRGAGRRQPQQRHSFRLSSQSAEPQQPPSPRALSNRRGRVFHCARLWGIIDLGRHEHVFFDRSIFKHVDDLQKHFKINDTVYFNAILATKGSRAKWRATQVWRESDRPMMERIFSAQQQQRSSSGSISGAADLLELADDVKFLSDIDESELRRVLRDHDDNVWSGSSTNDDNDAIDIEDDIVDNIDNLQLGEDANHWRLKQQQQEHAQELCSKCAAASNDTSGYVATASIATQTMSTGEIMAMQIFHDL